MTSSMGRAFAEFSLEHGVDPERFKQVIAEAYGGGDRDGMVARLERGELELEEFEAWLAGELMEGAARSLDSVGLKQRIFSGMQPDGRMVEVVGRLRRAGLKTALLSNSWGATGYERERFPDLFDDVIISAEVGMRKPEAAIYLFAAQRLGVDPADCVFVDDLEQNVEGARAVGMTGLVHRNADFTIPKLGELFGVPLSSS
jgi:epoxide hydrolase-like predicted phosphatase